MRSVLRSLRKSPCPDPTAEDHTRIVQSVNRTNSPDVDRSNFNTSSSRNSPKNTIPTATLSDSLRTELLYTRDDDSPNIRLPRFSKIENSARKVGGKWLKDNSVTLENHQNLCTSG